MLHRMYTRKDPEREGVMATMMNVCKRKEGSEEEQEGRRSRGRWSEEGRKSTFVGVAVRHRARTRTRDTHCCHASRLERKQRV